MNPDLLYVVLPLLQVWITERDLGIKVAKTLPIFFFGGSWVVTASPKQTDQAGLRSREVNYKNRYVRKKQKKSFSTALREKHAMFRPGL